MSAEKLDTANGMKNKRKVCQESANTGLLPLTLSSKATPMTRLMPSEFSQIAGAGSKYSATVDKYQIR